MILPLKLYGVYSKLNAGGDTFGEHVEAQARDAKDFAKAQNTLSVFVLDF